MFQTFENPSSPDTGPARLAALRATMAASNVDAFIVPRADRFQGEYVAPCDERLAWLTGFTGSAGFACITAAEAAVFVDGRYTTQVKQQVALDHFTPVDWPDTQLPNWLSARAETIKTVAFDPWLHTIREVRALEKAAKKTGQTIVPTPNLVDAVWSDQPAAPVAKFRDYPIEFAGKPAHEKVADVVKSLTSAQGVFISQPDSVAWLLNIRGNDIERNPVPHAMALVLASGGVVLFCDPAKTVDLSLPEWVQVLPEDQIASFLSVADKPIQVDDATAPYALLDVLNEDAVTFATDPCVMPKACKNPTEIAGARTAHLRDAAAVIRFLAWYDGAVATETLTEIDLVERLEAFRRDTNSLLDISFDTISGAGPNGALPHYRVSTDSNRQLEQGQLVVLDSGGQYLDGTTDITRTLAVGQVGTSEIRCYTRVLQGVIAISRARFPKGVAGMHLDALARAPLWADGLDFDHGTGHGVGAYLCVHEGPQRLSRASDVPLTAGMILSNEPGYYREGAFGIRLENLIVVRDAPPLAGGDAHRKQLGFETLTFVPFDRNLIDVALLSADERQWIDDYHAEVLDKVGPNLDDATTSWLAQACAPL